MKPAAPIFPVLDKSHLFVHLPTDPQNQSTRYVQCPATGHLYCMSTGSLYRKIPIIPLSTNIFSLPQGEDSCLLPSIPPPSPMKKFSVYTKNMDQQDIGPSTTVSIENILSPEVKVVDEPIHGNSAAQSNIAPNVINADQHIQNNGSSTILNTKSKMTPEAKHREQLVQSNNAVEPVQGNDASSISQTKSKVKHASQPSQGNSPSVISYRQHQKNPNVMKADQPIQGISASITPNTHRNEASKSKIDAPTQANSPVSGANRSAVIQSNSDATTNKKIKIRTRRTKNKSVPLVENPCANPKKKSASSKQKKSTVPTQPKPTTSFMNKNTALIAQTTKKCEASIHPHNILPTENKRKSYTYYQFCMHHTIKSIQPMQIHIQDILFPQNISPILDLPTDQLVQSNNAVEPVQGNDASSISQTKSKVKQASQPSQGNSQSVMSYRQHKKNPNVMKADQPIQGINPSITPNTHWNEASENKPYTYAQVASRLRGAYSSVFIQRNFYPTSKEKIKICSSKVKNKSAPVLEQSFASSKKKSSSRNQKKSTGRPQPKPTTSFKKKSGNVKNTASTTQTTKTSQSTIHPNNFQSQKKRKKNKRKSHTNSRQQEKNAKRNPVSPSKSKDKCAPGYTRPEDFFKIWAIVKPFNRRPHRFRNRKKTLLSSQCKNCIMASSVHEIIHSRFAKDTNEHMPVSQIKAMLSSGDRKLRTRQEWIQCMEEEAIQKYKKMNLEKNNQRLKVKEYEVQRHNEKYYLACSSRLVINRREEDSWPLLVKCLHKHPDSTLRKACKHRSFCLSWDGTSYTLRRDHAYYTEIQCHMAVTKMSYAELIVHTHKETTILPVVFDSDFWKQTEATLETFFTGNILPYLKKTEKESNSVSNHTNDEKEE